MAQSALTSLQRGDAEDAKEKFRQITSAGQASPQIWLYFAQSCELTGDDDQLRTALEPVLMADPQNLYALLMRGECEARAGDDRAASSWFNMALTVARQQESLPPDVMDRLHNARHAEAALADRFADHLLSSLTAAGIDVEASGARLGEALDILRGKAEPQLQQPSSFYYPRLPQIPFYDTSEFGWVKELEAAAPAMRAEVEAVLAKGTGLAPYVEADPTRPNKRHALLGSEEWSAYYLLRDGKRVEASAAQCPITTAALEHAPMPEIANRSPMALFSILRPHTHIPPHWGMLNTRLICHVPLIVPANCRLRVGNETRDVQFGKAMIFDDSIQHEAWNDSDETRVVLLLEIWRPELSSTERRALKAIFEAISTY